MRSSSIVSVGACWSLVAAASAGCREEARPAALPYVMGQGVPPIDTSRIVRAPPADADAGATVATPPSAPPGFVAASLGATRTPDVAPPPISGGTLAVDADGHTVVAADSDRDRVWIVDLTDNSVRANIALEPGDEPGRVALGGGSAYVALRRGGAVVTIDLAAGSIVARRAVCAAPRGVALDATKDLLYVACAGGELVTLPAAGAAGPTRTLRLDDDLRDVIVRGAGLVVTRFRSAEILELDAAGAITRRVRPTDMTEQRLDGGDGGTGALTGGQAGVAWRTVAAPEGVVMLHQRALSSPIELATDGGVGGVGGYGSGDPACQTGVAQSALSFIGATAPVDTPTLSGVALAVDVALSPDGERLVLAVPGNATLPRLSGVLMFSADVVSSVARGRCVGGIDQAPVIGQAVAVAVDGTNRVLVQTREPAAIQTIDGGIIVLNGDSREDTGHRLFHSNVGAFVACASCHPEGGDDGHVWRFNPTGARRTQNLRGGLAGTAPFHWDGDMTTFTHLSDEVFARRMGGGILRADQTAALEHWALSQPELPSSPPADPAAVARGRALFQDPTVGCTTCHSGDHFTSNATVDVGTGAAFQVPSLRGVAARTPLMHDGCAATLRDRFGACGGGDRHGHTSQLLPDQIGDLVAYLQTL